MRKITKFFKILAIFALLGTSVSAFEENKDYLVLDKPLNVGENTLVKVFSYGCKYCYRFDKSVTAKLVSSVEGLKFMPYHLKTKGEYGESVSKILAAMMVMDESRGVSLFDDKSKFKKAKFAIYKAQHDKGMKFKDKEELLSFALKAAEVSRKDYEESLASNEAGEILKSWNDAYDVAALSGVPAYVVNGKYLINLSSVSDVDSLVKAVKFLLSK